MTSPLQTKVLSPKELADAIGVSESSIKRWGDSGLIRMSRTAGGHRRILLTEALRFVREQGMRVLRPDVLGLPNVDAVPPSVRVEGLTGEHLFDVLEDGDAFLVGNLLTAAFLDGETLASLWDGPISDALTRLGALWEHDDRGIYVEHQATSACIEAVNQLRLLLPVPADGAPVAVGGAPPDDPYLLPTMMAASVLHETGYRAVNLGGHTPYPTFIHAVEDNRPLFVWVAVTSDFSAEDRDTLMDRLATPLRDRSVDVVVGGHSVENAAPWPDLVRVLPTMTSLADLALERRAKTADSGA